MTRWQCAWVQMSRACRAASSARSVDPRIAPDTEAALVEVESPRDGGGASCSSACITCDRIEQAQCRGSKICQIHPNYLILSRYISIQSCLWICTVLYGCIRRRTGAPKRLGERVGGQSVPSINRSGPIFFILRSETEKARARWGGQEPPIAPLALVPPRSRGAT